MRRILDAMLCEHACAIPVFLRPLQVVLHHAVIVTRVYIRTVLVYLRLRQEAATLPSTGQIALIGLLQLILPPMLTAMVLTWLL